MDNSESVQLRVERDGAIETWTIDRERRRNSLSRSLVEELGEHIRRADADQNLRLVLLTAVGNRAFCAGADLKERRTMNESDVRAFLWQYREVFGALSRLRKPTVAVLNGVALGGGLELALACDFRVASAECSVGLPEVSLAIIPGAGGTQRLTRIVGPAVAKELILFGRRLNAQQAHAHGIVHAVAPEGEEVLGFARRWAAPLAKLAPVAVSAALQAIDAAAEYGMELGLTVERQQYERTLLTEDRIEALAAFAEKREPIFRGK